MKTCACGGTYLRHGQSGKDASAHRYRCKACGKSITVRNGTVSTQRGRPVKADWRVSQQ